MFNIGPLEFVVLAVVGLIVLGPDRLPGLARDAARMLRTLRDLATGARSQLRDELGPEFADMDLRNLNPKTAIQRAVLGDDFDLTSLDPRNITRGLFDDEPDAGSGSGSSSNPSGATPTAGQPTSGEPAAPAAPARPAQKPLGRGEQAPYDADAT